jgi:hypothetical protein
MQFWISELALHGYSILFAAVFMEASDCAYFVSIA